PRADGSPRGQAPPGRRGLGPPTALYASDNRQIAGVELADSAVELIRVAITVDGKVVGELRSEPRRQLSSPQDTAFSGQQFRMSLIIGIAALAFAAALSFLLAHGLLAPIRRMASNVARLSSGDYSARLEERRNDELGQLMGDLDYLGVTLEEERSSRRRWLADISHELRTPLTILTGEIQALHDGVRRFDKEQLGSLEQEVERLRFLIDDLYELSVSDVGGLRYKMSTFNLGDSLQSVVSATQNRARDAGLEISVDSADDVQINGDVKRIDQLFQNLFENSIAYTDAPGRIQVSLAQSNGLAIVEINDTAPGATPEECEQLFEPLYRREASRNRRTGGAGLGLAICRNIVEAHRGKIAASPSALGGLCIRIEIPVASEINQ
ncbi:MAG: ATP-binding protein, partial [Woeseia sp.]